MTMAFDYESIFNEMVSAGEKSLSTDGTRMTSQVRELLANHQDQLKQLADAGLSGQLSPEDLKSEIEDELVVFKCELLAAKVAGEAALQNAINAVTVVLVNAVIKIIK
jgi:hypothetical protein